MSATKTNQQLYTHAMIYRSKKGLLSQPASWKKLPFVLLQLMMLFLYCKGSNCFGQRFQLATPLMKYESVFFDSAATVQMKFDQPGAVIYYTVDDQDPSPGSLKYTKPVVITKSFTTIKAFAAAKGFKPSAVLAATFIKNGAAVSAVDFPPANKKYAGSGPNTLTDNKGGLPGTNAGTWLGYQEDSVEIIVLLQKKQPVGQVLVDCLQDHGSWIFLPQQIQVFYFNEEQQSFLPMVTKSFAASAMVDGAACKPLLLSGDKNIETDQLKIVLTGTSSIPAWHPGKGEKGWLFIDEIKVY